jgi:hypothetical protein
VDDAGPASSAPTRTAEIARCLHRLVWLHRIVTHICRPAQAGDSRTLSIALPFPGQPHPGDRRCPADVSQMSIDRFQASRRSASAVAIAAQEFDFLTAPTARSKLSTALRKARLLTTAASRRNSSGKVVGSHESMKALGRCAVVQPVSASVMLHFQATEFPSKLAASIWVRVRCQRTRRRDVQCR